MAKKKNKNRPAYNPANHGPNKANDKVDAAEAVIREAREASQEPFVLHAAGREWELHPVSKLPAVRLAELNQRFSQKDEDTGLTYYEANPTSMIIDFCWIIGYLCKDPADAAAVRLLNTDDFKDLLESMLGSEVIDAAR